MNEASESHASLDARGDLRRAKRARGEKWKYQVGRVTIYNASRRPARSTPVEDVPMAAPVVRNAFVSGHSVTRTDTVKRSQAGAIYDGEGVILPEFLAVEGQRYTNRVIENPATIGRVRIAAAAELPGRHIYLGDFKRHFGDFLLESMARAWYLTTTSSPDAGFIFHNRNEDEAGQFKGFVRTIFAALSLDPARVVFAGRDLRVEELIVPSAQFWWRTKASPGYCKAFDHIRNEVLRQEPAEPGLPQKLYLTRREMVPITERKLKRVGPGSRRFRELSSRIVVNEEEAEALFASYGFHIVAPETLPIERQIKLIGNASHIAGVSGSALHMILFSANPNAKLICLGVRSIAMKNQLVIDSVRGIESHHIVCVDEGNESEHSTLDMAVVRKAAAEIL